MPSSTPDPGKAATDPWPTGERAAAALLTGFLLVFPWLAQPHTLENNRLKFHGLALAALLLALPLANRIRRSPPFGLRAARLGTAIAVILGAYALVLGGVNPSTLLVAILLPLNVLLLGLVFQDPELLPRPLALCLTLLLTLTVAACFLTPFQAIAIPGAFFRRTGLASFLGCLTLFFAAALFLRRPADAHRAVRWLLLGSIPVCLLALWQFYSPHGLLTRIFSTVLREPRPMATFGHTNWFGSYLLLLLPLALHYSLQPRPRGWPLLAALLFAATLVAQTRGAWIGMAFLIPFALWNSRAHRQTIPRLALLLLFVAAVLLPYDQARILHRVASLDDEAETALAGSSHTGSGRFGFWKYALRLVPRHLPLGSGLDTLPDHSTPTHPAPVDKAHSIYLEYAVTLGATGTAAYLLCLWLCFAQPRTQSRWPWLALLGTYLIQGVFIHDTIQTWPLLWILAALAALNPGTSAPQSNSCGRQSQTSC